jgi:hypothetical protein
MEVEVTMGRKTKQDAGNESAVQAARLDLIRRRYKELILETRAMIAAEIADGFGDPFEDMVEAEELHLVESAEMGRL